MKKYWLAVSTHFKHININHHGNLPQSRGEHQKYLKPPPRVYIISQVSQFAPTLNWGNYINYSIYGQIYISMGKHVEKIHENVINIQETSLQILRYHSDPFGSQIVFPPRNETSQSPSIIQIRGIQIVNSPLKLLPWQEEGVGWWVVGSVGWLDGPFPIKKKPLNSEGSNHLAPATWICFFGAWNNKNSKHNSPPKWWVFSQMVMNPS